MNASRDIRVIIFILYPGSWNYHIEKLDKTIKENSTKLNSYILALCTAVEI